MRLPLPRLLALLVALLLLVAWLQFRWIGELTQADRARLERARAEESVAFGDTVDREIFRLFAHFARAGRDGNTRRGGSATSRSQNAGSRDPTSQNPDPTDADSSIEDSDRSTTGRSSTEGRQLLPIRLEQLLENWASDGGSESNLLAGLFVVERPFSPRARLLEVQDKRLVPAPWPESFAPIRRAPPRTSAIPRANQMLGPRGGLVESLPAIMVPLNLQQRSRGGPRRGRSRGEPGNGAAQLLLVLDLDHLRDSLVPRAAQRFDSTSFEIEVRDHRGDTVYTTAGDGKNPFSSEDQAVSFLRVRPFPDLLDSRWFSADRRREADSNDRGFGGPIGAWQLLVRHRNGSIEAAVREARTRNLALSLGILVILGASAALVASAARRAQATANQQVEFVASLTHELHTPLAAISAAASNLADGVIEDPNRVQEYGTLIRREGLRLESLVAQALALAGIRSGRPQVSETIAVSDWLIESLDGCDWLAQERGAHLVNINDAPGATIQGDKMALVRALRNLVTNALKFGPEGGTVEVTTRCDPDSRLLTVSVRDQGPGFPTTGRDSLLEAFVRGENATAGGSGIGLHLAYQIALAHGGSVRLENRSDEPLGASATLELPLSGERA